MSDVPSGALTRRRLLRNGLVASVVGSAVSTTALLGGGPAQAATQSDASLLLPILGAELLAAFAYEQVIDASVFSSHAQRVARRVLAQERLHVAALSTELRRLDGTPPKPLSRVTDADKVLAAHQIPGSLGKLPNEHDALILLARIEWLLEGFYHAALSKLQAPRLLQLSAQVMANEAQHASMLSEVLHPGDVIKAVPSPFVLGTH